MNKRIFPIVSLLALLAGCATRELAPEGVYMGDIFLFRADQTIENSYDILQKYVWWEKQNRAALAQWPEIKKSADYIRANAESWINSAVSLREAYAAEPNPQNRDSLENVLKLIRQGMTEATTYMLKYSGS